MIICRENEAKNRIFVVQWVSLIIIWAEILRHNFFFADFNFQHYYAPKTWGGRENPDKARVLKTKLTFFSNATLQGICGWLN